MNKTETTMTLKEYVSKAVPCDLVMAESWIKCQRPINIKVFIKLKNLNVDKLNKNDIFKLENNYLKDYKMNLSITLIENACLACNCSKEESIQLIQNDKLSILGHYTDPEEMISTSDEIYLLDGNGQYKQLLYIQ